MGISVCPVLRADAFQCSFAFCSSRDMSKFLTSGREAGLLLISFLAVLPFFFAGRPFVELFAAISLGA